MSRFDYVKYDDHAIQDQNTAKTLCGILESLIDNIGRGQGIRSFKTERSAPLALTKLEECYMWIGKAIRDDQIARNGSAPLQEERKNG